MTVLKFEMSGRQFAWDGTQDVTADDLWALDEVGVTEGEIVALLNGGDLNPRRAARTLCALAYLAARREDPATTWAEFARTVAPGTTRIVTPAEEPVSVVGVALAAEQPKAEPEKPRKTSAPA